MRKKNVTFVKSKMSKSKTDQCHIQHCMLLFFEQGLSTAKATKAINDVLLLRTFQFWFSKFKSGNRNLINGGVSAQDVLHFECSLLEDCQHVMRGAV